MASIRERHSPGSNATTYAVLYRQGGRQRSTTFDDLKAAENFRDLLDLLGVDKALATLDADRAGGLTVDALFEQWISWKAGTDVTARTLKDYRRDYDNWIRNRLGHRLAESVDELDVQQWVDRITPDLDPKSVGDRHMILGSMYKYGSARSRRLVTHNPCLETQLPSKKRKAAKGFSKAQWDAMHAWGIENEPDADDLLLAIESTGWRFSEVTPMTPAAVEDYGDHSEVGIPILFVSVLGVHRLDENSRIVYVDGVGKSRAAIRRINLPPEAARMVRRRIEGLGPDDLIFTNRHGSQWRSTNFINREFKNILDGAKVAKVRGMGPHWLRHTHVGNLDRAGVSAAKMQRRIGHENIATTFDVYGGTIDNSLSLEELLRLDALGQSAHVVVGEVVRGELA